MLTVPYRWADPVAAFAMTVLILYLGWEVTADVLDGLADAVRKRAGLQRRD